MNDNIEFVDRYCDKVEQINYPKQIRLRSLSFQRVKDKFKKFKERISNLKQEIDTRISAFAERIKSKINILSKEYVPNTFVGSRPIRLNNKMGSNTITNSGALYSYENSLLSTTVASKEEPDLDVDTIDRQDIESIVNEGFEDAEKETNESETLGREDVQEVVEEMFNKEQEEEKEITPEEIKQALEEELSKLTENAPKVEEEPEQVEEPHLKISRNNVNNARIARYDDEGNDVKEYEFEEATVEEPQKESIVEIEPNQEPAPRRKKFNYVRMTDEEIRESQIKLGLDEHGNFVNKQEPQEEMVVAKAEPVVENTSLTTIPEYYINESVKPATNSDSSAIMDQVVVETPKASKVTLEGYTTLRDKIKELRLQQERTKQQKEEAARKAEEAKQRAREIREMVAESDKSVAEKYNELRAYSEALEEDCERNRKSAEEANSSAQADYDFISSNQEKLDNNAKLMEEIDMLIGPRVDPESIKVK